MKMKLFPIAIALAPAFAFAGTPINQTKSVDADATVEISNVKGSVTVSAWDKNEVAITGTLGDGSRGLTVEGGGGHLEVKVEGPDKSKSWFNWGSDSGMQETTLELKVPRKASLEIDVVSATVTVNEVAGRSMSVDSVSGRVKVDSPAAKVRVDAVSADVEFTGKSDDANIETVSGDVQIRGVGGRVHGETVSGSIRIEGAQPHPTKLVQSAASDIEIRGALEKGGRVHVESMSGDVRLRFPGSLSARLEAKTFSGSIKSDFGQVEKPEHGPGEDLDVKLGDGDGDINIDTFSGDVSVQHD